MFELRPLFALAKRKLTTQSELMRILVDAHTFSVDNPTGVSIYIFSLLRELATLDTKNDYTILSNAFRRKYAQRLSAALGGLGKNFCLEIGGFPSVLNRRLLDWAWFGLYLPYRLKRSDADVLFAPDFVLPGKVRCRSVVTVHDLCPILLPELSDHSIWHSPVRQIGRSISKADFVIADSESVRKDILRIFGVPEEKVVAIHLAADPRFRRLPVEEAQAEVKEKYGVRPPIALYAGTSGARKNLDRLLAAFSIARREGKIKHELVMAGPGTSSKVSRVDGVRSLGYVPLDDLVKLYNAADLFLLPSLYEGFGIPIVEAMSCGTPVMTSDRGAMREVAADAAVLVDPYDVHAMSEGILKLAMNAELRSELGRRGMERAKEFSWTKTARETLVLLEQAAQ